MFNVKKQGGKEKILVSDFKNFLQDKYQKYNVIGKDCKAKCAKTWKLVQNFEIVTISTFANAFVLPIVGFIVNTWCLMSSVVLIHYAN